MVAHIDYFVDVNILGTKNLVVEHCLDLGRHLLGLYIQVVQSE